MILLDGKGSGTASAGVTPPVREETERPDKADLPSSSKRKKEKEEKQEEPESPESDTEEEVTPEDIPF
jgi:hypothetical protein